MFRFGVPLRLLHTVLRLPFAVLRHLLRFPLARLRHYPRVRLPIAVLDDILTSAHLLDDSLAKALAILDAVLAALGLAPRLLDTEHPPLEVKMDTSVTAVNPINHTDTIMNNTALRQSILHIVKSMQSLTSQPFVIVGGASLILHGSNRTTTDVDFLIPEENLNEFIIAKTTILEGQGPAQDSHIASIDLLHDLNGRSNLRSLKPYVEILEGIPVLSLEVLLCSKFTSHFERPDDEAGDEKRRTDLGDIYWISNEMAKRHLRIRREVCNLFVSGPYHMLLVLESLYGEFGEESVELFESVGGRDLECDWGDVVFAAQVELYESELDMAELNEGEFKVLRSRRHPNFCPC